MTEGGDGIQSTVLVTGAAGFIGSALCERLLSAGRRVVGYDNMSRGHREYLPRGVLLLEGDIRDSARLAETLAATKPDSVIHLAATHFIPHCIARPKETLDVNVEGTRRVLESCRASPVRHVVFASTAAVYAPSDHPCVEETTPLGPLEIYGESKLSAERLATAFQQDAGLSVSILRLFNAVGPRETNPHVIPHIFESLRRSDVVLLGNMEPRRDYIDTSDIAGAMLAVLDHPQGLQVFNVGAGVAYSVGDIIEMLRRILRRPIVVKQEPSRTRATDRMLLVANIDKIGRMTRWSPRVSFETTLQNLVRAYGLQAPQFRVTRPARRSFPRGWFADSWRDARGGADTVSRVVPRYTVAPDRVLTAVPVIPATASDTSSGNSPSVSRHEGARDAAFWTFVAVAGLLLPVMVLASFDFGVTWDEKSRHKYGELIWEFYRGTRSRGSFGETGGHLYGGLFDVICAGIEQVLPGNRYVLRHIVNASFGWVGILYAGRLAARLFGRWTGVLAMVLLAASPRFFADAMNNPKDAPFAAIAMVALYYISTVSMRWPYISFSTAIKIVIALAAAMNIRVGALLYFGYLGMLVLAFIVIERCMDWRRLADTAGRLTAMLAAVLVLGTVCWPWAQASPFVRPFRALFGVANFPWNAGVLFNGQAYPAQELPWYYAPWWLLISTPPVVLLGMGLCIALGWRKRPVVKGALWFVGLLPLVVTFVMKSTLYDGIRHLDFIYPNFVVLAAAGWTTAVADGSRSWLRRSSAALLAVGLASILIFNVRFYPNQTIYFNALVDGPRGAFARYDMDYWGNCMLEAVAWTAEQARASGVVITVSGNPDHLVALNAERFRYLGYAPPYRRRHYLTIRLARGSAQGMTALAQEPALYQVKTSDGVVLCTVTPGPAFAELQALQARTGLGAAIMQRP